MRLLKVSDTIATRATMPQGWMLIRRPHESPRLSSNRHGLGGGSDGLQPIAAPPVSCYRCRRAPHMRYVGPALDAAGNLWIAHAPG